MARNHRKFQVGVDSRPGLKKIGQLDMQARARAERNGPRAQVGRWVRNNQETIMEVGPGHTAFVYALSKDEQWKLGARTLFPDQFA